MGSNPTGSTMKFRAPKGFHVRIRDKVIDSITHEGVSYRECIAHHVELNFHDEVVGYVDVIKTISGYWETHSYIDDEHRGRGLGTLIYAKAIDGILKRGHEVRSSYKPSMDARNVWLSRKLNGLYDIEQSDGEFRVVGRKS